MNIETAAKPNPHLGAYMQYVSDEGIDLGRFVEQGGRLLGREDSASLISELKGLREIIGILSREYPLFGRQLEFLAGFFESDAATYSEQVRNETAFALLYAVKDMDMMPDHMPGVGYLDDAAVVKVLFSRHAEVFERHCAVNGIEWAALTETAAAPPRLGASPHRISSKPA